MMPLLRNLGVASISWGPQGGGYLTRPYDAKDLMERGAFTMENELPADVEVNAVKRVNKDLR